jgi:formate hydrogenlyase transcriptional activator
VLGVLGLGRVHETAFAQRDIDFLRQVADQVAIALDNALTYGQIAHPGEQLYRTDPQNEDPQTWSFHEIIGRSKALGHVLQQVEAVAPTKTAALICGETGTGKELIARAIHDHSLRKKGPFIKVNCAALPAGLLESELFGHEKGAFTGASCRRCGRFELANDGTIFLDEIGELPLELQPKLLRVLQDGEFERVGSSKPLHTNARLIAATNRDLAEMVAENRFRADLFYRLNVFPLYLPPLRERREDIPLLARHFTAQATGNLGKTIDSISSEVMNALVNCVWPGNIRELQNVIERAVILSPGPTLRIPLTELKQNGTAKAGGHPVETLEEIEKRHILAILEQSNWILSGASGAAARLGMKRSTLQFRMHKLGITRPGRM